MFGSGNHSKVLGLGIAAFLLAGLPARAEDVTESQILKALAPPTMGKTRGLSLGQPVRPTAAAANPDEAFIDSLRNRNSRSLSTGDREKLVAVVADKPAIDLEMEFDYNSDTLRGPALETANKLGARLARTGRAARCGTRCRRSPGRRRPPGTPARGPGPARR